MAKELVIPKKTKKRENMIANIFLFIIFSPVWNVLPDTAMLSCGLRIINLIFNTNITDNQDILYKI